MKNLIYEVTENEIAPIGNTTQLALIKLPSLSESKLKLHKPAGTYWFNIVLWGKASMFQASRKILSQLVERSN